ncbi:hypothetical protein [Amphibacillus cookii]|uniref:hypothetical protein n=1 Tax=Amphibacillus cookii TaxID=767787 RepID=UPI001958A69A|nr:hypothetical protein [Amphibacillus cookii]MBM7543019.1 hypothetical protein [Amphibacillus cookii]
MNKKLKIILGIILGMMVIGGAITVILFIFLPGTVEDVYDDNERIASRSESKIYRNKRETVLNGDYQLSFVFSGIDTLWTVEPENNETALIVTYNSEITEGKFKAVLVDPDGTIQVIFEGTDQGTKEIPLKQGESRFRIVGEEAEGEINLSIMSEDSVEINTTS